MKPASIKNILEDVIAEITTNPENYVYNPEKDFSRNRKLPLSTVIKMIIGMGGNSLGKELLVWFGYSEKTVSASAFVQQRAKIKINAIKL